MDDDEIGFVLRKAAALQAKVSDAIERATKAELELIPGGAARRREKRPEGVGGIKGNIEARTLIEVRDALVVLEQQLESLQVLQQQQRAERDSVLAELEESRTILIDRLRSYHGTEWEVVHEALAFAGEPVGESDEIPLPPYPMPLDTRSHEMMDGSLSVHGIKGPIRRLALVDTQDEGPGEQTAGNRCSEEDALLKQAVKVRKDILGFQPFIARFVRDLFGKGVGFTAKVTMLAATVITLAFFADVRKLSDLQKIIRGKSKVDKIIPNKAPISAGSTKSHLQEEMCPPGRVMIMQDGHPKCVVTERTEIPFHREIKSPDVLYGRG